KNINVVLEFERKFGELKLNAIITAFEVDDIGRFRESTLNNLLLYIDKERISDYLQGSLRITKIVYPKSITDSSTNLDRFLFKINNFPEKLTKNEKFLQKLISKGGESVSPEIIKNDNLRTFDFGSLEGQPQTDSKNKAIHNNIVEIPDELMSDEGETFNQASKRAISAMKDIVETAPNNTLVITHNSIFGVIKLWDKEGR